MGEGSGHVRSVDSTDWQPSILPAVRVDERGGSDKLLIRIITLKRATGLTSELLEILQNEGLDVQHYDITSTKEKVLRSFQVEVLKPSELDIDDLKSKLHSWAANSAE